MTAKLDLFTLQFVAPVPPSVRPAIAKVLRRFGMSRKQASKFLAKVPYGLLTGVHLPKPEFLEIIALLKKAGMTVRKPQLAPGAPHFARKGIDKTAEVLPAMSKRTHTIAVSKAEVL